MLKQNRLHIDQRICAQCFQATSSQGTHVYAYVCRGQRGGKKLRDLPVETNNEEFRAIIKVKTRQRAREREDNINKMRDI